MSFCFSSSHGNDFSPADEDEEDFFAAVAVETRVDGRVGTLAGELAVMLDDVFNVG